MSRRIKGAATRWFEFGAIIALSAVAAFQTAPAFGADAAPTDRPNIVLIVADDLGYGELGCYGQQRIKTPRIDQLAAQGIRFTQFYAGSPVCAPSRCTLMTGKHPGHAYIRNNGDPKGLEDLAAQYGWVFPGQNPILEDEITIAELLKQRGYATAAIGKWGLGHFGTTGDPNRQGFDLFYGYNCQRHAHNHYPRFLWRNGDKDFLPGNDRSLTGETYSQDRFTEEALQFIRQHRQEPFFLYLPFAVPHVSIQVPDSSLAQYAGEFEETDYKKDGYERHPTPHAGYAAMVSHWDRDVGTIVDLIDELGLGPQTLILLTSDNGPTHHRVGGADSTYFNSAGPLRGRKGSVWEGGLRVPLIARWTGEIPPGRESDLIAAFWDLLPTICASAGVEPPDVVDGISLLPTLRQMGQQPQHDYLYWEFAGYGGQQAVRQGDWKALRQDLRRGNRQWQLYNLAEDLAESRDLAEQRPAIVAQLASVAENAREDSPLFPLLGPKKQ